MIRFVVIQRLPDGRSRLVSLLLMEFSQAARTQRTLASTYPHEQFEVAVATRADREQIARVSATKTACKQFFQSPVQAGKSLLSKALGKMFPGKSTGE